MPPVRGERRLAGSRRLPVLGGGAGQAGGEVQVHGGLPGVLLAEQQPRQADAKRPGRQRPEPPAAWAGLLNHRRAPPWLRLESTTVAAGAAVDVRMGVTVRSCQPCRLASAASWLTTAASTARWVMLVASSASAW